MNVFTGMGRLTRDPELRKTTSGIEVASFTIAINRRFKNANGEYEADFLPCVAWRGTATFISNYFHKGSMIGIVGSVQTRKWDDQEGKTHYATEVIVEQAHFCGSKSDSSGGGYHAPAQTNVTQGTPLPDDADTTLPFDI